MAQTSRQEMSTIPDHVPVGIKLPEQSPQLQGIATEMMSVVNELLNDYSDEIPPIIINSTMEDKQYKVRKAWFTEISLVINELSQFKIIVDEQFKKQLNTSLKYIIEQVRPSPMTTPEHITLGNRLLRLIEQYLQLILQQETHGVRMETLQLNIHSALVGAGD